MKKKKSTSNRAIFHAETYADKLYFIWDTNKIILVASRVADETKFTAQHVAPPRCEIPYDDYAQIAFTQSCPDDVASP